MVSLGSCSALTLPGRRRFRMLTVAALLLPDRLILVPARSTTRAGAMVERNLLFDHFRAASWSTGYAGAQQIPILQLTGATGDPVVIRFGAGSHRATADFVAATRTTLARWLPSQTLSDSLSDPVRATRVARAGPEVAVTLHVLSIAGGYVASKAIKNATAFRKAAMGFVGFTQGVSVSTAAPATGTPA